MKFKEYRALAQAARATGQFKEPKIVRCKDGDWFIGYSCQDPKNPGKWRQYKERAGLNYIKDIQEKERAYELLRVDVLNWLLAGNRPFDV